MKLITTVAPDYSTAPVTLAHVKAHLRADGTDEDTLIGTYRLAAINYVAALCSRPLAGGTYRAEYDHWECEGFVLPVAPVSAISSVKYRDSTEVERTVSSADYITDTAVDPARVVLAYGKYWPTATLSPSRPILIAFTAGHGITGPPATPACPDELKAAIFLLCGHWYNNREAVVVGDNSSAISVELERGVKALLSGYVLDHWGAIYAQ